MKFNRFYYITIPGIVYIINYLCIYIRYTFNSKELAGKETMGLERLESIHKKDFGGKGMNNDVTAIAWKLFELTGNTAYYELYAALETPQAQNEVKASGQ